MRWTVPVTTTAEGSLDLVGMLIGTGGGFYDMLWNFSHILSRLLPAREDALSVLHVHLPLLTGAMSRKGTWQARTPSMLVVALISTLWQ